MLPVEWRIGQLIPITFHIRAASLDKWGSTPQPLCPSGAGGSGLSASLALRRPSGLPASGGPDGQGVLYLRRGTMTTPWQALVAAIALVFAVGAPGRLVFMRVVIYDYQKSSRRSASRT